MELPGSLKPTAQSWEPGQSGGSSRALQQPQPQQQIPSPHLSSQLHAQQQQQYAEEGAYTNTNYLEADRLTCKACTPLAQKRYSSVQLPPELRGYFAHSLKLTMEHIPLTDPRNKEVPKGFNLVNPLDDPAKDRGAAGSSGYPTIVYKVVNRKDGFVYALRRIDNVRSTQSLQRHCEGAVQLWSQVRHANIVALRQAFVHQRALYLVHDYWPGAQTLLDYVTARGHGNLLPEEILWGISTQLLVAIRTAHERKVSFRGGLVLNRVLLTGRNRVRVGSVGLSHILDNRKQANEEDYIAEDVVGYAKIMLTLCCMSTQALRNWKDSLEFVSSRYSKELTALVSLPFQRPCRVFDLLALSSRGLLHEIDEMYSHTDTLEDHLCRQLETSRLNRLLVKLNLVNERPEYGKSESASWAETGDRYILKLFRDYVFHQTDDTGQPWLDIGHIWTSLNKLDIGSMEKILLTSRDGRSILVVTFADVRKCLDEAFAELSDGHRSTQYYQRKATHPSGARATAAPARHAHTMMQNPMTAPQGYQMTGQMAGQMAGQMGMNPYAAANMQYASGGTGQDQLYTVAHHQQQYH